MSDQPVQERFTIKDQGRVIDAVLNRLMNGEIKAAEASAVLGLLKHPIEWMKVLATAKKAGLPLSDALMHAVEMNGAVAAAITDGKASAPSST